MSQYVNIVISGNAGERRDPECVVGSIENAQVANNHILIIYFRSAFLGYFVMALVITSLYSVHVGEVFQSRMSKD